MRKITEVEFPLDSFAETISSSVGQTTHVPKSGVLTHCTALAETYMKFYCYQSIGRIIATKYWGVYWHGIITYLSDSQEHYETYGQ